MPSWATVATSVPSPVNIRPMPSPRPPCADGDSFDATFRINGDGELTEAEITGAFFSGSDSITYTIDVEEYGVEQEISAPE